MIDQSIQFFTDIATITAFDPELLSSKLNEEYDWWMTDTEYLDEITNGDIAIVMTGYDGVFKVRITDGELTPEERDYAREKITPLGLKVQSGKVFLGKGECIPADGVGPDDKSGAFIDVENGQYEVTVYLIDWIVSPKWWSDSGIAPEDAPADFVFKLNKVNEFSESPEELRFDGFEEEFLFESETRVIGPAVGQKLKTNVRKCRQDLTLANGGPCDYQLVMEDYSEVQWKDEIIVEVISVDHEEERAKVKFVRRVDV